MYTGDKDIKMYMAFSMCETGRHTQRIHFSLQNIQEGNNPNTAS